MTMERDLRNLCAGLMSQILGRLPDYWLAAWEFECGSNGTDFEVVGP